MSGFVISLRNDEIINRDRAAERYETYRKPLDQLWSQWLALGRKPDKSEVLDLVMLIEGFGSLPKALRFLEGWNDLAEIEQAAKKREEDLEVYFALNQFARRPAYKNLEQGLRFDIKSFFVCLIGCILLVNI